MILRFKLRIGLLCVGLINSFTFGLHADDRTLAVSLAPPFGDSMVLQRDVPVSVWGKASAGSKVTVAFGGQSKETVADASGRWLVKLDPLLASSESRTLTVASGTAQAVIKDVLVGEVWLCSGQSNMVMTLKKGPWCVYGGVTDADKEVAAAHDDQLRIESDPKNGWIPCTPEAAPKFSAIAYYFGRALRTQLKVPVGIMLRAVGGTPAESWVSRQVLLQDPEFVEQQKEAQSEVEALELIMQKDQLEIDDWKKAAAEAKANGSPLPSSPNLVAIKNRKENHDRLNAVLHPGNLYGYIGDLVPMNFKGAIWYQGESNTSRSDKYEHLLSLLIYSWRDSFGDNFPFFIVQLSSFGNPVVNEYHLGNWSLLREAQYKDSLRIPNVGIVPTYDCGAESNIHYPEKSPVGDRLAQLALKQVYQKNILATGPRYTGADFLGDHATVRFQDDTGLLVLRGTNGFQLAGADRKWFPAQAQIKGNTVELSCPEVLLPVAVRYAWLNYTPSTLFNKAGWPAFPFRSDDWIDPPINAPPK